MRVTCQHCAKALTIADDKAPAHPFQLTCPACKKSFVVNPVAPQEDQPNDVPQGEKRNVDTPAPAAVGKLPRLRPAERDLLASIVPVAYIVDLAQSPPQNLAADLERLGMEEVRRFESLDDALETLSDTGAGILVICMDKASAPPCAPLRPLERLTYNRTPPGLCGAGGKQRQEPRRPSCLLPTGQLLDQRPGRRPIRCSGPPGIALSLAAVPRLGDRDRFVIT